MLISFGTLRTKLFGKVQHTVLLTEADVPSMEREEWIVPHKVFQTYIDYSIATREPVEKI